MATEKSPTVRGVTTQVICARLGIASSTLDHWIAKGLCQPTLLKQRGHRYQRYWTLRDVAVVRTIKQLRASGLSLQKVALVRTQLEQRWDVGLSEMVVLWDGHEVLAVDGMRGVMTVLDEAGQLAFEEVLQVVSVPFARWLDEADGWAQDVDVRDIQDKRTARLRRLSREAQDDAAARLVQKRRATP